MNDLISLWRPRSRLAALMVAASARLNYEWALRRPGKPPFIMLTEFPRSGGNWVRDMLADAMQIPAPRFSRLPITFAAIAHNHDHRPLIEHRCIYVLRDPRDIFFSHFAKTWSAFVGGNAATRRKILRLHPSFEGHPRASSDIDLERFYAEWLKRPVGSRVGWREHVAGWLANPNPQLALVRYEDMHNRPAEAIAEAVHRLTGKTPDPMVVDFAIARNSFTMQTGRQPGEVDPGSTKRQGLVGAWRNDMPAALSRRFETDFGEILKKAGYES